MFIKNAKILLTYLIGVVISFAIAIPLSPIFDWSEKLFSSITALICISLIYSDMWSYGKYDGLRKQQSLVRALLYLIMYAVFTIAVVLGAVLFKTDNVFNIPLIIGNFWMYPFSGFFSKETFLIVSVLSIFVIVAFSVLAYYLGSINFSIIDKLLIARKKSIDKKAAKHYEDIEKIKEQYRNK